MKKSINESLAIWNKEETIIDLFEKVVEKYGEKEAVVYKDQILTYKDLDSLSNKIGHVLSNIKNKANKLVVLYIESSQDMIIGILGTVKAGAAYVPINTNDTVERKKYILEMSKSNIILTNTNIDWLSLEEKKSLNIVDIKRVIQDRHISQEITVKIMPTDLLYVFFTSGTTGLPKGVMINHANLVSLFSTNQYPFKINENDVWSLFHAYSFDFSVWEMYGALLSGGKLVIIPEKERNDLTKFINLLNKEHVTILGLVPSVLYSMDSTLTEWKKTKLRYLFLGGEGLNYSKLHIWKKTLSNTHIVNIYGLTETTIFNLYKVINFKDIEKGYSNIGIPMPGHTVYIVEGNEICDIGKSGELCICGPGIGPGYWNDSALTEKKFTNDILHNRCEKMIYTGDIAKMHSNGCIEYLGRIDNQVKVRGYRIELEYIESYLLRHSKVENAAIRVIARKDNTDNILVAYISFNTKKEYMRELEEVKGYLKEKLPTYMIPAEWIVLDKIPTSLNGKVDRSKLPEINLVLEHREVKKPCNKLQIRLIDIWKNMLQVEELGIDDSFYEMGGHSLLAMQFLGLIKKEFNVQISMSEFIIDPTIEKVEQIILEKEINLEDNMETVSDLYTSFDLTDLQQAYYIGRQTDIELGNCATYVYTEIEVTDLHIRKLEQIVNYLICRHPILRTVINDDGTQEIREKIKYISLKVQDISQYSLEEQEQFLMSKRKQIVEKVLDYSKAPIADLQISKINNTYILHLYFDALIIDGWSYELLLSEADQLYTGEIRKVPELKLTFKHYVKYLQHLKNTNNYVMDKEFWQEKVSRDLPGNPQIPIQCDPTEIKKVESKHVKISFTTAEWEKLEKSVQSIGVSTFVVTLTAFCKTIAKYSKTQKFIINIPVSFRPNFHEQVNSIVGVCSNYFLLIFENIPNESLLDTAKRIQKLVWELNDHNTYSGTEVIRELYKRNGHFGENIAQIVFTSMIDVPFPKKKILKRRFIETHTTQIWLDAVGFRLEEEICFTWDYVKGLLYDEIVNEMADVFKDLVRAMMYEPSSWMAITEIPLRNSNAKIIECMNGINKSLPNKKMPEILFQSILKNKGKLAIISSTENISYESLYINIKRLISSFIRRGICPGDRIAVVMRKGVRQIESVLAITIFGGVYVPIEIEQPIINIINYIERTHAVFTIADEDKITLIKKEADFSIASFNDLYSDLDVFEISYNESPNGEISIIFTSGSTGESKGIPVTERGLLNALLFTINEFEISSDDRAIALTSICHDMSMFDIFGMIIVGGAIVIPNENEQKDPERWIELIDKYNVSIWNSVPHFMEMLESYVDKPLAFNSMRLIIQGGDFLKLSLVKWIKEIFPLANIINVGGPTETTLWSIYHKISDEDVLHGLIPYGHAIWNMKHFIVNDNLEICPMGVTGQIISTGIGVSQGYIDSVAETEKHFIQWNGKAAFLTGDMGRYLKSGEINIIGRQDTQIKIHGKRIEVEAIEYYLEQIKEIVTAVVKADNNNEFLVAYYISKNEIDTAIIRKKLAEKLPLYMIPQYFVKVEHFPVTLSGKIDRKALQVELKDIVTGSEVHVLGNHVEDELKRTCCEMLGIQMENDDDNFFMMGGNSISAIKLLVLLRKKYGIKLKLSDIIAEPTIKAWSTLIYKKLSIPNNNKICKEKIPSSSLYPLCSAQQGVWLHEMLFDNDKFTLCAFAKIYDHLDTDLLEKSLKRIVALHDIFGIHFQVDKEGNVLQFYEKYQQPILKTTTIKDESELDNLLLNRSKKKINLLQDRPYDFEIFRWSEEGYCLLVRIHHIIADMETIWLLFNDIFKIYMSNEEDIDFERTSYLSYCAESGIKEVTTLEYWKEKLDRKFLKYIDLNPDVKYKDINFEEKKLVFNISAACMKEFKEFCVLHHATLFDGLLAVFSGITNYLTGDRSIWISTSYSDRINDKSVNTYGMYIQNLLLNIKLSYKNSFIELLNSVNSEVNETLEKGELSIDDIARRLSISTDISKLQSHIIFTFVEDRERIESRDLKISDIHLVEQNEYNPLNIFIENGDKGCKFILCYRSNWVSEDNVKLIKELLIMFISNKYYAMKDTVFELLDGTNKKKENEIIERLF